jgi:tRNA(fMet)-specific endonuclease VapC
VILDTNALSAIAGDEGRATEEFRRARDAAIPVIVLGEYRFGIAYSRRRWEYEAWLGEMIAICRVLDGDEETAAEYASLRAQLKQAGTPIPSNDAWIAALCRQHTLPILSRDRHFDLVRGVRRASW